MAAPQYAILRFAKYKGPEISGIEAHNERTKEKYESNPDIDPTRTHLNFHLIKPERKYRAESEKQIAEAGGEKRFGAVISSGKLFAGLEMLPGVVRVQELNLERVGSAAEKDDRGDIYLQEDALAYLEKIELEFV